MHKYIVYETANRNYELIQAECSCVSSEKWQISEDCNYICSFHKKEDAEKFLKWKLAEEQGKLLLLPAKVGDKYYTIEIDYSINREKCIECEYYSKDNNYCEYMEVYQKVPTHCASVFEREFKNTIEIVRCVLYDKIGNTIFLKKEDAELELLEKSK